MKEVVEESFCRTSDRVLQLLLLREHQLGMGRQQGVQRGAADLLNAEAISILEPSSPHRHQATALNEPIASCRVVLRC